MHSNGRERDYPPIDGSTCAAVVSAYRPPADLVPRIKDLLEQFSVVVVVDDGSADDGKIIGKCRELGALTITSDHNRGIAAALNRGVAELAIRAPSVQYVVTFDQDSSPPAGLLPSYQIALHDALDAGLRVGSLSPGTVGLSSDGPSSSIRSYCRIVEPIQSGTLIPLWALRQIGGFDESLFIDGVDTDTYWRLVSAGYCAIAATDVHLKHALGSRTPARILGRAMTWRGKPILLMQSAPFRYYYLARNRCALVRRYWRQYPAPMVRGSLLDLRHMVIVMTFGSDRKTRTTFAFRGFIDGCRGISGRIGSVAQFSHRKGESS